MSGMMRPHAIATSAAGLIPFGHMGWAYHERDEFLARAAEYIADGLRLNQRVAYIGAASAETLRAELAVLPGMREAMDAGRIDVGSTAEYYTFRPGTDVIDVDATLRSFVTAVEDAVAAGFTGFRSVVDVTAMVRTPEQREAQTALEFLADEKMTVLPFSGLCAYNIGQLGGSAAEMICVHPFANEDAVDFRLYAHPEPEIAFTLTGQVDLAAIEPFAATIKRLWPLTRGETVQIDATELEFIGHEHLSLLDEQARTDDCRIVLLTNQRSPARLVELLGCSSLRVQPVVDTELPETDDQQLDSRTVIDQVQGILMRSLELSSEQAFAVLVNISRKNKLLEVVRMVHEELTKGTAEKSPEAVLRSLEAVRKRLRLP